MVTRLPPLVPELSATGNCSPKEGDIGPKHLGKIERGEKVPSFELIIAIARELNASPSTFRHFEIRAARKPPETAPSARHGTKRQTMLTDVVNCRAANVREGMRESANSLSSLFCSSAAFCRRTYAWVSPE
jgi:transcriptional regulator with XRE-family HTH domain